MHHSITAPFHWQRSDNSFTFNFSPEILPSSPQNIMDPNESHPVHTTDSEGSSGFAFNFQIPVGTEQGFDPKPSTWKMEMSEAAPGSEPSSDSKTKAKKKKKKKKKSEVDGGEEAVPQSGSQLKEDVAKQESTELTPEQQLSRELDWCIEQLELGLKTQKSSTRQREEASRALKTLRSSKAPMVKKRQVMRAVSGDYRKKMEEDRDRQYKLIRSAMTLAKVTRVSEPGCKAVYHRRAETLTPAAHSTDTRQASIPAKQTDEGSHKFVFRPSGEEFHFNFNL